MGALLLTSSFTIVHVLGGGLAYLKNIYYVSKISCGHITRSDLTEYNLLTVKNAETKEVLSIPYKALTIIFFLLVCPYDLNC